MSEPPSGFGEQATALQSGVDSTESEQASSGIVGTGEGQQRAAASASEREPLVSEEHITDTLPKRRRNRVMSVFILALVLLVAGGLAWTATRDSEPVVSDPIVAEPLAAEPTGVEPFADEPVREEPPNAEPEVPGSAAQPEQEAENRPAEPKRKTPPTALAPASLTVVVYPWGDVWINGKPRGSAPLKSLSLKPGRYEISAGQGKPAVTQTFGFGPASKRS